MTVYCIKRLGDERGLLKFGYSANLNERVRQYRQQHPEGVELIVAIPGDRDLEAVILEALTDSREVGEWFKPTEDALAMLDTLKRVAAKRRGRIGDVETDSSKLGDAPAVPASERMTAIWAVAPDLSQIPDGLSRDLQSLDWDTRHSIAVSFREWGAEAAEWIMPELKLGRPA